MRINAVISLIVFLMLSSIHLTAQHFQTIWSGGSYHPMAFTCFDIELNGVDLESGDEVGVFDIGNDEVNICVGAGVVNGIISPSNPLFFMASQDDEFPGINGFTPGNTIMFKIWDSSDSLEYDLTVPQFDPMFNNVYASDGTAMLTSLMGYSAYQQIDFLNGWNIISFNLRPNNMALLQILQPLILNNELIKVIDEGGNFIQEIPGYGWMNTIGDMVNTEGYYIKVNQNTLLDNYGLSIETPFEIDLFTGWNIMGYPLTITFDAISTLQPLIDSSQLTKVIDQGGGFMQEIPGMGWLNTIGDFEPGEGYYIKVNQNCILTVGREPPTITTQEVSNISAVSAMSGGNITFNGGAAILARGVCWSIYPNPSLNNNHTTEPGGTGLFTSTLTNLSATTQYYVRAYATNSEGTSYGNHVIFTTDLPTLPTVTTIGANNITTTGATSGGEVESGGGIPVLARGICWSTSSNPTLANNHTIDGSGTGIFGSTIAGLLGDSIYFVRAYATNSVGTAYGNEISFATLPPELPSVLSHFISNATQISAEGGGEVLSNGGAEIIGRGVCWSITETPTTDDNLTFDGQGTGSYLSTLYGLVSNTNYYARAYATNSVGTAYGDEITFSTLLPSCNGIASFEYGGQSYNTVEIGQQCWMAENLNIGTRIPASYSQIDNGVVEKYCLNNDEAYCSLRGGLYQWNEMMQYTNQEGSQGICPDGWHLPADSDWKELEGYTDSQYGIGNPEWDNAGFRGFDAGKHLKDTIGWFQNTGTNSFGFNAIPGGYRTSNGFSSADGAGYWWSTNEFGGTSSFSRIMTYNEDGVGRSSLNKNTGISVRCIRTIPSVLPVVSTDIPGITSQTSAEGGGQVISDGGYAVVSRGICWGTSPNPTLSDSYVSSGDGVGTFTSNMSDLNPNTTYYVRAYATNCTGTAYGNNVPFTATTQPFQCGNTINYSGQNYTTVLIGSQCWMAENLNIGNQINGNANQTDNNLIEKYCMFNDSLNCNIYGGLYQWSEMMQYSTTPGSQGICPAGWHIPTDSEWCILETELEASIVCDATGWRGTDVGGKLKESGLSHWLNPNTGATNSSNFNALPSGLRFVNSTFPDFNFASYFWSSNENGDYAWIRMLTYNSASIYRGYNNNHKLIGYSVRCLKD